MPHHTLTVGISVEPLVLRVLLLAAVMVVAGFAVLRGFLGPAGRRTTGLVVGAGGVAGVLELLLSGGLALPQQVVPVLLLGLGAPLYLVLSRDPRYAAVVARGRGIAPVVCWPAATLAFVVVLRGFAAGRAGAVLLHTGVVLALVAIAWFVVARQRWGVATVALRVTVALLAVALLGATAQATMLVA